MSINEKIILAIVGISSGIGLFKSLKFRTYRSWLPITGFSFAVMSISYFLFPRHVAQISFGYWGVFMVLPSIGMNLLTRKMYSRDFSHINKIVCLLKLLHPFRKWNEYQLSIEIGRLIEVGETEEAEDLLKQLNNIDGNIIHDIEWNILYCQGRWEKLLDEIGRVDEHTGLDAMAIAMKIRALAETTSVNEMVHYFDQSKEILIRDKPHFTSALLFLFAFNGKREIVNSLLEKKPLSLMPDHMQAFWKATSEITAGEVESGHARLKSILESVDQKLKAPLDRRLAIPLPVSKDVLSPESLTILDQETDDFAKEITYDSAQAAPTKSPFVLVLIAVNVLVFIWEFHRGAVRDVMGLFEMGALFVPSIEKANEWWRLFTATFLHYDLMHVGLNMMALYWLGPFVEHFLGKWRFILTYMLASVGSMGLIYLLAVFEFLPSKGIVVGASGGVMGLIGATGAIMFKGWKHDQANVARKSLLSMVLIIVAQVFLDWMIPNLSMAGHLGGAAIGFLIAWIWMTLPPTTNPS